MLTRSQVAKRLGRSVATVRKMEGQGLHPVRNERGVWLFDEAEVDEVAREVEDSGRALTADHDNENLPTWPAHADAHDGSDQGRLDPREFRQAQLQVRAYCSEVAALQARVEALEDDDLLDADEQDDDGDERPSSHATAFAVLLLGSLGFGLFTLLRRAVTERQPSNPWA